MFDAKKLRAALLVLSAVAIVLSVVVFCTEVGSYQWDEYYGGDAYTGIQQAAAQTANNVRAAGRMLRLGIGSLLMVHGLAFGAVAFCIKVDEKKMPETVPVLVESVLPEEEKEAAAEERIDSAQVQ